MIPVYFKNFDELLNWFRKNHDKQHELWVGYYKKSSGRKSITWPESVDAALCFGWIDGIRKSLDEQSYVIRFTPRNPKSSWSLVNVRKAEYLIKLGMMQAPGLAVYYQKREEKSGIYSFEKDKIEFDVKLKKIFTRNRTAWKNFNSMIPSYKKQATHWVTSAKREETRLKRLNILIEFSEKGEKIPQLRRN